LGKYISAVEKGSSDIPKLKKELEKNILDRINYKREFKLLKQYFLLIKAISK
jgi:hypothetical protein